MSSSKKLDNLRPIGLLSVFYKIIEKLMKNRITKYLDNLNFFSTFQFGFRKGKSTEDALLIVSESIYNSFNIKSKATGLFIDLKKAFDFVYHTILLRKLSAAGVRGLSNDWFNSFLSNRIQKKRKS